MLSQECVRELPRCWLPNTTHQGLHRLLHPLEKGRPLLIHGSFPRAAPMGGLATHMAGNHPRTCHETLEAGTNWLTLVAGLNPATSLVIREWDRAGAANYEIRADLLTIFKEERQSRQ